MTAIAAARLAGQTRSQVNLALRHPAEIRFRLQKAGGPIAPSSQRRPASDIRSRCAAPELIRRGDEADLVALTARPA